MKKEDIPLAKDSYIKSNESDSAFNTAIHNIIIGIEETTHKGLYEYTHWSALPTVFSDRLQRLFTDKGYSICFIDTEETEEKNSLGWNVEKMKVFIKWH